MIWPVRLFMCAALTLAGKFALANDYGMPPRVAALLEQGESAEKYWGNYELAMALYCDAGRMGSPEGYYRVGLILRRWRRSTSRRRMANAHLALAARLGHQEAVKHYDERVGSAPLGEICRIPHDYVAAGPFNLERHISGLSPARRKIAAYIRQAAPIYGVDVRFALGVALAESNLNPRAVSVKNAQGVMQLIPQTQKRFGVKNPFDPKLNVRGGLAYLRWLKKTFKGNLRLVAAAYNAGEGAVRQYGGVPPYPETHQYVRRVFYFSGVGNRM